MKKIIVYFLTFVFFINTYGQKGYVRNPSFAIHYFSDDFQTASEIRTTGLATALKNYSVSGRLKSGLGFSYIQGISEHADFVVTGSGAFLDYPVPDKQPLGYESFLMEVAATVNVKLLTDKYFVSPFLTAGVGASMYRGYYGAFIPLGVGLQFNFSDDIFVLVNSQYRVPVTEEVNYHFYHSIGIGANLFKKKEALPKALPVPVAEPVKDRDGDGIVDSLDKCPDVAGIASLQGCPDKDGDGIADAEDKCPEVAGVARYNGCPIPDTDHDGINDENDKCPTVAGVARYQGCPVPDTDGDGVNDEEDKCPNVAGSMDNFGCPVIDKKVIEKINVAAKNIFFSMGSSRLSSKSFKSLNEVVKILKDNPSYKMDIEGNTDNTGKPGKNQDLSESRATAVATYIQSKDVNAARLAATGNGQDKPVADNKTAGGRAKNRRVELKVKNY
ncbi:OmpA family protein [Ferruginibacter sp.]|uniref:OmpA family protein n=1 Tax=Ferruginibacter sp. TaxID=1940288 RepID=UPI00265B2C91|nr:OmpA family protein [Ferruginibacter sp.]